MPGDPEAGDDLDGADGGAKVKGGLGIQSVEIGMRVLTALSRASSSQSLANTARACGMSPTKTHRYLTSLERAGYVEREPGTGHFRLGASSVQLGLAALSQTEFSRIGSEVLPSVCRDLDETVFMTVWAEHGATIVRWEDTGRPIAVNVRVGSTMPLLQSATGRVFAAYLPWEVSRRILQAELEAGLGRPLGIVTEDDARALFSTVRSDGFGFSKGFMLPGINAIAAPVFNHAGQIAGAITALGLSGAFNPEGRTTRPLLAWAERLSARLGAPPSSGRNPMTALKAGNIS